MPTRTVYTDVPGPVNLEATCSGLPIQVIAEPDRTFGEITISTNEDTGPAADIVNSAKLDAHGRDLAIHTSQAWQTGDAVATGPGSIANTGILHGNVNVYGGSVVQAGNIYGSVHIGGDPARAVRHDGAVQHDTAIPGISVVARVPERSNLWVNVAAGLSTSGHLARISAKIRGGGVDLGDAVDTVSLTVVGGDVHVAKTGPFDISTTTGSVAVDHAAGPGTVRAVGGSADVYGDDNVAVDVHVVGGSVTYGNNLSCTVNVVGGSSRSVHHRPS